MLGRLLRPWISLRIEPDAPQRFVDPRPVCYVLEDYGLSNALILDRACRENGMPSPLRPLPGDPLGRKRAYVALSRRSANSALAALAAGQPADRKSVVEGKGVSVRVGLGGRSTIKKKIRNQTASTTDGAYITRQEI